MFISNIIKNIIQDHDDLHHQGIEVIPGTETISSHSSSSLTVACEGDQKLRDWCVTLPQFSLPSANFLSTTFSFLPFSSFHSFLIIFFSTLFSFRPLSHRKNMYKSCKEIWKKKKKFSREGNRSTQLSCRLTPGLFRLWKRNLKNPVQQLSLYVAHSLSVFHPHLKLTRGPDVTEYCEKKWKKMEATPSHHRLIIASLQASFAIHVCSWRKRETGRWRNETRDSRDDGWNPFAGFSLIFPSLLTPTIFLSDDLMHGSE